MTSVMDDRKAGGPFAHAKCNFKLEQENVNYFDVIS